MRRTVRKRLLSLLAAAAVLAFAAWQWRQENRDAPGPLLTLDGHTLDFGEISVTGPQCYVRVDGRVALVSVRYMPRASRGQAGKLP